MVRFLWEGDGENGIIVRVQRKVLASVLSGVGFLLVLIHLPVASSV